MAEMNYQEDIHAVASLSLPWERLSGCNILVTGATGLIGSCLLEVLMSRRGRDYHVFALGRNAKRMYSLFERYAKEGGFHQVLWDITQPLTLEQPFHYIIHCASGAAPADFCQHPVEVMKANLLGLINLMDYGIGHSLHRMLYVSSGEVYGEGDGRVFVEDYSGYVNPLLSRSCYPSSKRAAETLCASYGSEYDIDVVVARPCHIYGPHFTESDNRVYAQFIRNVLRGEDIVMKSTGEQFRSWCYVADCVSALLYILLKGISGEAYNIADENSNITIRELAETVACIGSRKVIIDLPSDAERNGFNRVTKSLFDTKKLTALGWKVRRSMKHNMESTILEARKVNNYVY